MFVWNVALRIHSRMVESTKILSSYQLFISRKNLAVASLSWLPASSLCSCLTRSSLSVVPRQLNWCSKCWSKSSTSISHSLCFPSSVFSCLVWSYYCIPREQIIFFLNSLTHHQNDCDLSRLFCVSFIFFTITIALLSLSLSPYPQSRTSRFVRSCCYFEHPVHTCYYTTRFVLFVFIEFEHDLFWVVENAITSITGFFWMALFCVCVAVYFWSCRMLQLTLTTNFKRHFSWATCDVFALRRYYFATGGACIKPAQKAAASFRFYTLTKVVALVDVVVLQSHNEFLFTGLYTEKHGIYDLRLFQLVFCVVNIFW